MSVNLRQLRDRIDVLDEEILQRLNERASLAQAIGHLKRGPIYRPEREAQVIRRLQTANTGPLSNETIERLFREVMSSCRALEQRLSIAYLGPQGTFSEAAAIKHFGRAAQGLAMKSIDEVFVGVERGEAHYGVVPVENSSEGAVGRTLDLLLNTPLKVAGEVMLRVRQNLMRQGEGMAGLERVYSHAQSLAQCQTWLNENLPDVERIPVASNAEAASLAGQDPTAAAIASDIAAGHFGLNLVARNIEDNPHNTTRFLVLSREEAAPSGKDKTSLAVWAKNRPGALMELIAPFAQAGVGLTKLESRPARSGAWEYVFFIDIEGHHQEARVSAAIRGAEEHASRLKVLGSYPTAL